jgi:NitT/TauT family transport system ATP-binding protein
LSAPGRIAVAPDVIRRTLDGKLKIAPDGTYRSSDRYLLVGRDGAARPDPVQAAWLYAQMVRWGQALMSAEGLAEAKATFRPDLYDEIFGPQPPLPASEPGDRVGAFTGPAFDPDNIAAHLDGWKIRRR